MSKCVTSERCCEIWNLIHEEAAAAAAAVVVLLLERGEDYCKPCLKGNPRSLPVLPLAAGRESAGKSEQHRGPDSCHSQEVETKGANVGTRISAGRQR